MPAYGLRFRGAAALLAAACALLPVGPAHAELPTPSNDPTPADIAEAKTHMAAGVAFVQDPGGAKWAEAYAEFMKAYQLSGSLNALQNLGNCAMHLERDGEAIEMFEAFLAKKQADPEDPDRQQVERDLAAMRTAVAWVTLSADRDSVTVLDERTPHSGSPIRNSYTVGTKPLRVGVHPGLHRFVASVTGMPDRDWKIDIKNGSKSEHRFTMATPAAPAPVAGVPPVGPSPGATPATPAEQPAPASPPPDQADGSAPIPWYVWAAGGATVAAAIPMTIFMIAGSSNKSDYDDNLVGKAPVQEQQDARDTIQTQNALADVFLGVTVAGAAATVVLYLLRPGQDDSGGASARAGAGESWTVTPAFGPRGGGASFSATF
jgi:hypothetical protein